MSRLLIIIWEIQKYGELQLHIFQILHKVSLFSKWHYKHYKKYFDQSWSCFLCLSGGSCSYFVFVFFFAIYDRDLHSYALLCFVGDFTDVTVKARWSRTPMHGVLEDQFFAVRILEDIFRSAEGIVLSASRRQVRRQFKHYDIFCQIRNSTFQTWHMHERLWLDYCTSLLNGITASTIYIYIYIYMYTATWDTT